MVVEVCNNNDACEFKCVACNTKCMCVCVCVLCVWFSCSVCSAVFIYVCKCCRLAPSAADPRSKVT